MQIAPRSGATPATSFDAAFNEHLAALQARDIARFAMTLSRSNELCLVGPTGETTRGFEDVYEAHRAWFAMPDAWSFESRELWRHDGETTGVALHDVTYRGGAGQPAVRFLLSFVFARESDGVWRLVFDQNTPIATTSPER